MAVISEEPYPGHNFRVEIPGVVEGDGVVGHFSRVSGLEVDIDVVEYRMGNARTETPLKLPGLARYPNLVLERGVIGDLSLWEWIQESVEGGPRRVDGSVELLDEEREPVVIWRFRRGWPCRYRGPSLAADGSAVALELLEISHEGLSVE